MLPPEFDDVKDFLSSIPYTSWTNETYQKAFMMTVERIDPAKAKELQQSLGISDETLEKIGSAIGVQDWLYDHPVTCALTVAFVIALAATIVHVIVVVTAAAAVLLAPYLAVPAFLSFSLWWLYVALVKGAVLAVITIETFAKLKNEVIPVNTLKGTSTGIQKLSNLLDVAPQVKTPAFAGMTIKCNYGTFAKVSIVIAKVCLKESTAKVAADNFG